MLITSTAVVGIHTQGLQAVYPGENLGVRITAGLKSTINGIIF
jgi:V8-like Glu-specific endopeptidase